MNINTHRRRTATNPLEGVKFTALEERTAMEMARTLADLPYEAITAIKRALGARSLELENAQGWTTPGTAREAERRQEHEWTLTTLCAIDHAPAARINTGR